jgi:hypothetical protein
VQAAPAIRLPFSSGDAHGSPEADIEAATALGDQMPAFIRSVMETVGNKFVEKNDYHQHEALMGGRLPAPRRALKMGVLATSACNFGCVWARAVLQSARMGKAYLADYNSSGPTIARAGQALASVGLRLPHHRYTKLKFSGQQDRQLFIPGKSHASEPAEAQALQHTETRPDCVGVPKRRFLRGKVQVS